jgi:uncharacterized LabA/DUF88 family protein
VVTVRNQAFIDAQNLHLGTTKAAQPWKVDLKKFRVYLEQKYRVSEAYYFFGAFDPEQQDMYTSIQQSGYVLIFREHGMKLTGKKKGNVDVDIVFNIMRKLYLREDFDKVVLVSGDGDYKRMVDFLIKENKFEKILFPCNAYASSLYKPLTSKFCSCIDGPDMRVKFGFVQK